MGSMRGILITIVVLAALFWAYTWIVPAPSISGGTGRGSALTLPASGGDPNEQFGPGQGVWVNMYDKSNALTGRFRAAGFDPHSDGSYHLLTPEAEFYQHDGQIVHMIAKSADMRFDSGSSHRKGEMSGTPNSGTLYDITVEMFTDTPALLAREPDETLMLPIAEYDNTLFRIYTIPFNDPSTHQPIEADQVPITIRGKDIDFDGNGLTLYWNDVTRELKSLVVNHGRSMCVKNAVDLNQENETKKEKIRPATLATDEGSESLQTRTRVESDSLFSAAPQTQVSESPSPMSVGAATRGSKGANQKQAYHATFADNVHVTQEQHELAAADRLDVIFGTANADSKPTVPEAKPASVREIDPTQAQLAADTQMPRTNLSEVEMPRRATMPAIKQAVQKSPVMVTWRGPLTIVPATGANAHLASRQRIYRFTGTPARVVQNGSVITGDHIVYNSAAGTALVTGGPGRPMWLTDTDPATGRIVGRARGETLRYSRLAQVAEFTGSGEAEFPDPDEPTTFLRSAWGKSCTLNMTSIGDKTMLQRAVMAGDASVVDAPASGPEKLHLSGDAIAINFENVVQPDKERNDALPTKKRISPGVSEVVATGNAQCMIREVGSPPKFIQTQSLTIRTGKDLAGKPFPQLIVADGEAHASDGTEDLRSSHMAFTLGPKASTRPATQSSEPAIDGEHKFELVSLAATGNVVGNNKDGSQFQGDALRVETRDGRQVVTLIGNPPVVVTGNGGTLHAPEIDLRPNDNWALIPGPGVLDAIAAGKEGQTPRPVHIAWDGRGILEGSEDRGDVSGNVDMRIKERDGSIVIGKSNQLHLTLGKKPDVAGADTRTSTRKSDSSTPRVQFLKDQQVTEASLIDKASIDSTLYNDDGTVAREEYVTGERIDLYVLKGEEKLVVPGAGRMLIQDHSTKGPNAGKESKGSAMGGKGTTGFAWSRRFIFDQNAKQALMESNTGQQVEISHLPDDAKAQPMKMFADRIVTDFEIAPAKEPAAGSTRPNDADDKEPRLDPKRVHATGHVKVQSRGALIESSEMIYDPTTKLVTAVGQEGDPVRVTDDSHRGGAAFRQAIINTETGEIQSLTGFSASGRR